MKTYLKYIGTKSCLMELKDLITMKLTNIKKNSISHIDIDNSIFKFLGDFHCLPCFPYQIRK